MKLLSKRPYDSAIVVAASGALVLAIGIVALRGYFEVGDQSAVDMYAILTGTLAGAGIIASGILSLVIPEKHRMLGAAAMILSVLSFVGTSGGLYIGAIGGLLGGIMGISWHRKDDLKRNDLERAQRNP